MVYTITTPAFYKGPEDEDALKQKMVANRIMEWKIIVWKIQ